MSNRKRDFLGMPHGTASNRLKKMILFHLLKKHGENICFKCGNTIDGAEQLSIEHKKIWEGISRELFWDMDNIAFSHLSCNKTERYGIALRKVGAVGKRWCSNCKEWKLEECFWKNHTTWHGFNTQCNDCYNKERKVRRHRHTLIV